MSLPSVSFRGRKRVFDAGFVTHYALMLWPSGELIWYRMATRVHG
ncbi:MAG TPA: hypothetical protein VFR23_24480 [Jiangellaceae bacterium]|nr:hypothetical protein [Jiangellaceae bacterium]